MTKFSFISTLTGLALLSSPAVVLGIPLPTFSDAGATAADIQDTVDAFRVQLGGAPGAAGANPNIPVSFPDGRREINWDAVPAGSTTPDPLPEDFFNQPVAGRARGAEFPTTVVQVSNDTAEGDVEFSNLNPTYLTEFQLFSGDQLFAPVGSTITNVLFFLPGTNIPAFTDGFGAVFTDVDLLGITRIDFFGINDVLLASASAPVADGGLSFLGVAFDRPELFRVVITTGNTALQLAGSPTDNDTTVDVVVMDDFIYGEPMQVPAPATLALLGLGLAGISFIRRRQ